MSKSDSSYRYLILEKVAEDGWSGTRLEGHDLLEADVCRRDAVVREGGGEQIRKCPKVRIRL